MAVAACSPSDGQAQEKGRGKARLSADTLGATPSNVRRIPIQTRRELVENSGVTSSVKQPGVLFVINDSGNEPLLFAFDTAGADRGMWRVTGVQNTDWEAISIGRCASPSTSAAAASATNECLYVGDTGDNSAKRPTRTILRIVEPPVQRAGYTGSATPQRLVYRYSDGPHDVEAMYVAPNGSVFLITKRPLRGAGRSRRPALVFEIPGSAWANSASSMPVVAQLVDSLPIVPGTGPRRLITDAALSPDGRRLAVRTYEQVWVFSTDPATGRVVHSTPPGVCYLSSLGRWQGEGIAWFGREEALVLTAEGRGSPMFAVNCPMPNATP